MHFHDQRHTGNTLAAQAGATMSDPMARMGHDSARVAQIYLHTTPQRDRVVAEALNPPLTGRSGTVVARHAVKAAPALTAVEGEMPEAPGAGASSVDGAGDENRTRTVSLGS